jgi:hypothetical protein
MFNNFYASFQTIRTIFSYVLQFKARIQCLHCYQIQILRAETIDMMSNLSIIEDLVINLGKLMNYSLLIDVIAKK